jgi:HK97 family phage major capsid protein
MARRGAGVKAAGTDGNKVAVVGDLGGYIVADRGQLSVTILRERYADVDQVGVVLIDRVGGALGNPDAVRIAIV